jgi:hypothetical protein
LLSLVPAIGRVFALGLAGPIPGCLLCLGFHPASQNPQKDSAGITGPIPTVAKDGATYAQSREKSNCGGSEHHGR